MSPSEALDMDVAMVAAFIDELDEEHRERERQRARARSRR